MCSRVGNEPPSDEEWAEIIASGEYDGEEVGFCDECDKPHENASRTDHCPECGNCWDHCGCVNLVYDKVEPHIGHHIEVTTYGTKDLIYNVAIECLDCCEVVIDADNPYINEPSEAGGGATDPEPDYTIDFGPLVIDEYNVGPASYYNGVNPNGVSVVGYPDITVAHG